MFAIVVYISYITPQLKSNQMSKSKQEFMLQRRVSQNDVLNELYNSFANQYTSPKQDLVQQLLKLKKESDGRSLERSISESSIPSLK